MSKPSEHRFMVVFAVVFALVQLVFGVSWLMKPESAHSLRNGISDVAAAVGFAFVAWVHWRRLRAT